MTNLVAIHNTRATIRALAGAAGLFAATQQINDSFGVATRGASAAAGQARFGVDSGFNSQPSPSVRVRGFQLGGLVTGTPGVDRNLARLTSGEFVINRAATRRNRSLLEDINEGREVQTGGNNTTVFNISTPDVAGFRRSRSQIRAREQRIIERRERRRESNRVSTRTLSAFS